MRAEMPEVAASWHENCGRSLRFPSKFTGVGFDAETEAMIREALELQKGDEEAE